MNSIDRISLAPLPATRISRTDTASAQIIDRSLGVQACYGTFHAAQLLKTRQIPLDVALRVLLRTGNKRPLPPDAALQLRHYGMGKALAYSHTWT